MRGMSTRSERRALLFLGVVACLGGGVRVIRANASPPVPVEARRALDARISSAAGKGGAPHRVSPADTTTPVSRRPKPITTRPAVTVVIRQPFPDPAPDRYHRVDVDQATAQQLQTLPGIGPTLAARIIAFRDSAGPFGGLKAFGEVKGIGPSTLARLDTLIRFSGIRRR